MLTGDGGNGGSREFVVDSGQSLQQMAYNCCKECRVRYIFATTFLQGAGPRLFYAFVNPLKR
jgi:hypothetical protein